MTKEFRQKSKNSSAYSAMLEISNLPISIESNFFIILFLIKLHIE